MKTTPTLDLIALADQDEATVARIMAHPSVTSEDCDLALFLLDRAADARSEVTRRTEAMRLGLEAMR